MLLILIGSDPLRSSLRSDTIEEGIVVEPPVDRRDLQFWSVQLGCASTQLGEFPLRPSGTSLGIGLQATPPPTEEPSFVLSPSALAAPTFMCNRGGGVRTPSQGASGRGAARLRSSEPPGLTCGLPWSAGVTVVTVCWLRKTISLRRDDRLWLSESDLGFGPADGPCVVRAEL